VRLFDASLEGQWTLDTIAAEVATSADHLNRQFRAALGITAMRYLADARAKRAAVRLVSSTEPISVIGRGVGWSDPTHFSRRFKRHFRITPTEYRRRGRPIPGSGA
jgi:transcriptional regulator GlxA family with amidase domain